MIHYTDERVTLHHGDCLDVLRELPDASVDAVCTDPPYSLTDRREENCACDMLRDAIVTDAAHDVAHLAEQFVTLRVSCGIGSAAMIDGVHLDIEPQFGEVEVQNDRAASGQCDRELVDMGDPMPSEQGSGGEFRLWVRQGHARCVGACRCLGKGSDGRIRVPVRLSHYPASQAQRPAGVVAVPATELAAVLALDVARGTAELLPASGADALDPAFEIRCTEDIGALARAGGLPAVLEPGAVGEVANPAGGAVSFDLLVHRTVLSWRPSVLRGFMASLWDGTGIETDARLWRECLRVLKPGGYCLAFGAPRTYHNLATAIEQSGFELRDSIAWMQGAGFPKSLNVGLALMKAAGLDPLVDEWTPEALAAKGLGTALKPAFEPIVVARKPLSGTVAANVTAWGTGALNIAATRVGTDSTRRTQRGTTQAWEGGAFSGDRNNGSDAGRWPTNVVLTHAYDCGTVDQPGPCVEGCPVRELDAQSGVQKDGVAVQRNRNPELLASDAGWGLRKQTDDVTYGGSGGASRYFPTFRYEAKAPTIERPRAGETAHPTVKPLDLMRWLVRLVTPRGGTVLEPFAGSGTTAEACVIEGMHCIAIEREADYLPLIVARLSKPIELDLFAGVEMPTRPTGNGRDGEASAERRYTAKGGTNFAMQPGPRYDRKATPPVPEPMDDLFGGVA